jgi:hypothetical protein
MNTPGVIYLLWRPPGDKHTMFPSASRACDSCRRKKAKCVILESSSVCVNCQLSNRACTFVETAPPRRPKRPLSEETVAFKNPQQQRRRATPHPAVSSYNSPLPSAGSSPPDHSRPTGTSSTSVPHFPSSSAVKFIPQTGEHDAFTYPGGSILSKTLGLEKNRFTEYIGTTGEYETLLLDLFDDYEKGDAPPRTTSSLRLASSSPSTYIFSVVPDHQGASSSVPDLPPVSADQVEEIVGSHGPALVALFFRIVHPSFPILHKEVFLEKYRRTYREIHPHLLAAVYALAANWWSYERRLPLEKQLDEHALFAVAQRSVLDSFHRPRLNTVQAGLLLLQRNANPHCPDNSWSWAFTASLIAVGQHLGLHLDCSSWAIPDWEKGLRRRLAWALFVQDIWGALVLGRPPHIHDDDWAVQTVIPSDFPETSDANNDDHDKDTAAAAVQGRTSIEDGRVLFVEMIRLSRLMADVGSALYSARALSSIQEPADVLSVVQPHVERFNYLARELPQKAVANAAEVGRTGRLCANGYLQLAYHVAVATIDRRVCRAMEHCADRELVQRLRASQRVRAKRMVDFVSSLGPEQLEAFWYPYPGSSLVILGSFIALLYVTSKSAQEADDYRGMMDRFRWTLRIKSKGSAFISYALTRLLAVGWDRLDELTLNLPSVSGESSAKRTSEGHHREEGEEERQQQQPTPAASFDFEDVAWDVDTFLRDFPVEINEEWGAGLADTGPGAGNLVQGWS